MESVPGADRGPRAGSPRGVVDATGLRHITRILIAAILAGRYSLPVLTSLTKVGTLTPPAKPEGESFKSDNYSSLVRFEHPRNTFALYCADFESVHR